MKKLLCVICLLVMVLFVDIACACSNNRCGGSRRPAPIARRAPAPVVRRAPAPVVRRAPAPVVRRAPAPARRAPARPQPRRCGSCR